MELYMAIKKVCKPANTYFNLYLPILGAHYVVVTYMHVATTSSMTFDNLN